MRTFVKTVWSVALVFILFAVGLLVSDKLYLRNQMIRLRVVGASNGTVDQRIKLQVKDSVNAFLSDQMIVFDKLSEARRFLSENLSDIEEIANNKLKSLGSEFKAKVYLTREAAPRRDYETFSLPAGIYETLRVDIGPAVGENWWCVIFPSLCAPKSVETFADAAETADIRPGLTGALMGSKPYKVRFFLLDVIGKIENKFHFS